MANLTKRDFESLTTEVVRVAREINKHCGYACTITFFEKSINLMIIDEKNKTCACSITFYDENFVERKAFSKFYTLIETFDWFHCGRMLHKISHAYMDRTKNNYFINF